MKRIFLLLLMLVSPLVTGCSEVARKDLSEQVLIAKDPSISWTVGSFDYDPVNRVIYVIQSHLADDVYASREYLYKYDLATQQQTQLLELRTLGDSKTTSWVNVSKRGTVLVYDNGEYDRYRNVNIPPALIELDNDREINRTPVVSYAENWSNDIDIKDVCRTMLEDSPTHIPLGYEDVNDGLPSARQEPIKLAPRFLIVETAEGPVGLDIRHCGEEMFAEYVKDIDTGNIASYNTSVLDAPRGDAWLWIEEANLSFVSHKKPLSFFTNFNCEKYEGELIWGDYRLMSEQCVRGILDFPTSMNLFISEHEVVYKRHGGIYMATKP